MMQNSLRKTTEVEITEDSLIILMAISSNWDQNVSFLFVKLQLFIVLKNDE